MSVLLDIRTPVSGGGGNQVRVAVYHSSMAFRSSSDCSGVMVLKYCKTSESCTQDC